MGQVAASDQATSASPPTPANPVAISESDAPQNGSEPALPVAPEAFDSVEVLPIVEEILPRTDGGSPTGGTLKTPDGSYDLHPNVILTGEVVYYIAFSRTRQRSEFAVGPGQLSNFMDTCAAKHIAGLNMWEIGAANYFGLTGRSSEWQRLSAQVVFYAMPSDWSGY